MKSRDWGLSLLFVDDSDEISQDFASSLSKIPEYNVMPTFGEFSCCNYEYLLSLYNVFYVIFGVKTVICVIEECIIIILNALNTFLGGSFDLDSLHSS